MRLKDKFYYKPLLWAIQYICKETKFPDSEQTIHRCSERGIDFEELDVNKAFVWERANEGHYYWQEIHSKLTYHFKTEHYFDKLIKEYEKKVGLVSTQLELF